MLYFIFWLWCKIKTLVQRVKVILTGNGLEISYEMYYEMERT